MAAEDFDVPDGGDMFPGGGDAFPSDGETGDMMGGEGGEGDFASYAGPESGEEVDAFGEPEGEDAFMGSDAEPQDDGFGKEPEAAPEPETAKPPAAVAAAAPSAASGASAVNPMASFNRKFREQGEEKDSKERDAVRASRERGSEALRSWMAEKEAQLETRKQQNRTDEEAKIAEMETALTQEPWTRVLALVDTSTPPTDGPAGKGDPARMRELLIQLKAKPLASDAAAASASSSA